jgi:probable HAF family extracellular repeat protein
MKPLIVKFFIVLIVISALAIAQSTAAAPHLINLGTLGGDFASANDINNRGQVVGGSTLFGGFLPGSSSHPEGSLRAFLWEKGNMIDLGTAGGISSSARVISNNGKIAGIVDISLDPHHQEVFLWENGVMTIQDSLGLPISIPFDINNRGQMAGVSISYDEELRRATFWQNGEVISLETPGEHGSDARAINESGQVLVSWWDESYNHNAFVWKAGQRTDLGSLGGCCTYAQSINESGMVAGWSLTPEGIGHVFVWKNGKMTDLGLPAGWNLLSVTGVNNAGQVVVNAWSTGGTYQAFLWERGVFKQLEDPYGVHAHAQGVNQQGQVIGFVQSDSGMVAATWDNKGKLTVLGSLGGVNSGVSGINNRGQVIGWSETADLNIQSFLWNGK